MDCISPGCSVQGILQARILEWVQFSSVQFSSSVMSDSLQHHELQHARPPCPSPTPGVHPNPCPLSRWCHPTISSSVLLFSYPQSSPASGSFQVSQLFASGGQNTGVSASTSVLPTNTRDWSPFRMDWLDLFAVQGTLKILLQHHSSKASILRRSAFFIVQLSHPYMTTGKTMALIRDPGSIPRLGRSPREGNGNRLQYSCLENSMDGGAWWATVHGVAKSRTRISDFTFTFILFD